MCHTICPDAKVVYYRNDQGPASQWLYGWKVIELINLQDRDRKTIIRAPYTHVPYRVDWDGGGVELEADPKMQMLEMYLPATKLVDGRWTVDEVGPIKSQTLGGIHISPFRLSRRGKWLLLGSGRNGSLETDPPGLVVPVSFQYRDILFFDGQDLSVLRCWIPYYPPEPVARAGKGYFGPALRQLRKAHELFYRSTR